MNDEIERALSVFSRLRIATTSYTASLMQEVADAARAAEDYDSPDQHFTEEEILELMKSEELVWRERVRIVFHFGLACSECWQTLRSLGEKTWSGRRTLEPLIRTLRMHAIDHKVSSSRFQRLWKEAPSHPPAFFRWVFALSYEPTGELLHDTRHLTRTSVLATLVALRLERSSSEELLGWTQGHLAEISVRADSLGSARRLLLHSWKHFRRSGGPGDLEAYLLFVEACILRSEGRLAESVRRFKDALEPLTEEDDAERIVTLVELAEVTAETGDLRGARTAIAQAEAVFKATPETVSAWTELLIQHGLASLEIFSAEDKLRRFKNPTTRIKAAETYLASFEKLDPEHPKACRRCDELRARLTKVRRALEWKRRR